MSYLGVPVSHVNNMNIIDGRVKLVELGLRVVIFGLSLLAALLIATDSQVKEIFSIRKKATFKDMKSMVFLVIANGIAAGYSLVQVCRCIVSIVRGSVLFNKPLAWVIFSGDQLMTYVSLAAVAAAAQSSVFAKLGQSELQWMKVCDLYNKYCNKAGEGFASALIASLSMVVLSGISGFSLFRLYGDNKSKSSARDGKVGH
ncbi:hypothetical protein Leryth_024632 [Lithospermum erythrorhizon]|uniref:CASP-like protein n=1 Tax=Lithospermum erythrorhizon TaxID=34254 RepID=A0AAV3RB11_LITER|nr:hypothetical protein Leryth_024632 [Lithospermum erythrorhizon]